MSEGAGFYWSFSRGGFQQAAIMATQKAGHGLHQESHAGGAARASGGRGLDFLHDARRKMTKLLTVSLLLVLLTCGMASGDSANSPPANDVSFNLDRGHRLTVGSFSFGYLEVTERFVSNRPSCPRSFTWAVFSSRSRSR